MNQPLGSMLRRIRVLPSGCRSFSSKLDKEDYVGRDSSPSPANPEKKLSRKKIEEEYHLGRCLSRVSLDKKKKYKIWSEAFGKYQIKCGKDWLYDNDDPVAIDEYFHFGGAKYEIQGLQDIHERSFHANVMLEIRDVRVPGSSHHPSFTRLGKHRLHLICYTHADMIDAPTRDRVESWTKRNWPGSRSMFVDTKHGRPHAEAESFVMLYQGLLKNLDSKGGALTALTVGVPNVGKSSVLVAMLRTGRHLGSIPKAVKIKQTISKKKRKSKLVKGPSAAVDDVPGKTREITEYLVRDKPRAYFLDVPGITPPPAFFKERPEAWYGYGATNLIQLGKKSVNDVDLQTSFCDYVLSCANRDRVFQYVDKLQLDEPTDDIHEALSKLSNKYAEKLDEDKLQLKRCSTFLKLFNTGNFGPLVLDDISRPWNQFKFRDEHFPHKYRSTSTREQEDSYTGGRTFHNY